MGGWVPVEGRDAEAGIIIWRNLLIVQSALRWYSGFVLKSHFRCVVWKLRDFFLLLCLAQGQLGRGETRMCAGLVLESIEGVLLSSSSARRDLEWQPDLITWRSLEGAVIWSRRGAADQSLGKHRNRRPKCRKKWTQRDEWSCQRMLLLPRIKSLDCCRDMPSCPLVKCLWATQSRFQFGLLFI